MAVNVSPIRDDICHTVYETKAAQAEMEPRSFVVEGKFSDEPSGSAASLIVPGVRLPYNSACNSSVVSATPCVHISQRYVRASDTALPRVDLSVENDSSTLLQQGSASGKADVELLQEDMFTSQPPPRPSVYGETATKALYAHCIERFAKLDQSKVAVP